MMTMLLIEILVTRAFVLFILKTLLEELLWLYNVKISFGEDFEKIGQKRFLR